MCFESRSHAAKLFTRLFNIFQPKVLFKQNGYLIINYYNQPPIFIENVKNLEKKPSRASSVWWRDFILIILLVSTNHLCSPLCWITHIIAVFVYFCKTNPFKMTKTMYVKYIGNYEKYFVKLCSTVNNPILAYTSY